MEFFGLLFKIPLMILKQTFKKCLKVIFLVITLVSITEGLLWILNKPSQKLFIENALGLFEINKKFIRHLSVNEFASSQHFKKEKNRNTFRFFVIGEQINSNIPHNPNSRFSHILNYKLQHIFKDKNIELVNIAFDSSSSFELSKVCRQVQNYEPDLVMICPGKDEFYGKNAYPNNILTGNPELDIFLRKTHIYQGIKNLFSPSSGNPSANFNSSVFKKTVENFEINLDQMVLELQEKNIPVILVNATNNLLDVAPQKNRFSSPDSIHLKKLFEEGEKAYTEGNYDKAYASFSKISHKEMYHAQTLFYLGKLALKNHDLKLAQTYFQKSADNDPVKLRTPSQINNAIFRIASTRNCPFIDAEKLFFEATTLGIPGNDLFSDEQNTNLRGNLLLADVCLQTIFKEGYISKTKIEDLNQKSQVAVTPFDSIYDKIRSRSSGSISNLIFPEVSTTFEEQTVTLFAEKKNSWEESMNQLYEYYIENKNYGMAFKIIENLVLENPYNISLNDKASKTAASIGDSQMVIHYAARVYKMKPNTDIAQSLVINYLKLDMPESALPYLKYIRNRNHNELNIIYSSTNQIIDLKKLLKHNPNDPNIRAQIAQQYHNIGNDEVALLYSNPISKI